MAAEQITNYIITDHATTELQRRGLTAQLIDSLLKNPEQRLEVRSGRVVVQSRVQESDSEYLVRVFVHIEENCMEAVKLFDKKRSLGLGL